MDAIKTVGEWELDVLGVPYGGPVNGRDAQGEYFDHTSNLHEDKFGLPPAVYYHGFDEAGKPAGEPIYIGKTTAREQRADGVWYRVALDRTNAYAQRVWEAAKRGVARASSGSVAHLRRVAADGHILHWPVVELSLFDAVDGRRPANAYAVAVPVTKAIYLAAGLSLPEDMGVEPEAEAQAAVNDPRRGDDAAPEAAKRESSVGEDTMDEAQIAAIVAQAMKAEREAAEKQAAEKATAEQTEATRLENEALKAELAAARRLPSGAPWVTKYNDRKYDGLDAGDLEFLIQTLSSPSNSTLVKRMEPDAQERAVKTLYHRQREAAGKGDAVSESAIKSLPEQAVKANEVNYSTYSTFGDEWVGVAYSTRLWEKIRQGTFVVNNLPAIEMPPGMESMTIPLEGADPTWYKVAQATAIESTLKIPQATVANSPQGTANKSLTLAKMGARVIFTGEMEEDSLIPWVSNLRRSLERSGAEQMEYAIIDGDTATGATTNINDIAGTPAATDLFLLVNGFRKSPLVTTTANSRSAGTLAIEDYLETLKLMGTAGANAADMQATHFIVDPWTHWKSLELAELKTRDVYAAPTIERGELVSIYGHPVHVSYFMCYAGVALGTVTTPTYQLKSQAADGKIDQDTEADNVAGSILAVRWDQWLLGWRRRMTTELTRIANADATEIVAMMRWGLAQRDTEASAISYGVTL